MVSVPLSKVYYPQFAAVVILLYYCLPHSLRQIIKPLCVCVSVYPSVRTLTVAFLDGFSP